MPVFSNPNDLQLIPINNPQETVHVEELYDGATYIGVLRYCDNQERDTANRSIVSLWIASEYRSQGYGTHCLQQLEKKSLLDAVTILTSYPEPGTEGFYAKSGFRAKVLGDPTMIKTLKTMNLEAKEPLSFISKPSIEHGASLLEAFDA